MANLTKTQWPLGWTPSASPFGDSNGLLRADNLTNDETGTLTLVRGLKKIFDFPAIPVTIFPRNVDGNEIIYAGMLGGTVTRNGSTIASGTDRPAFADALGKVFITAGTTKKKDSNGTLTDLGLDKPVAPPTCDVQSQIQVNLSEGTWTAIEGHDGQDLGDGYKLYVDPVTLHGSAKKFGGGPVNTLEMGGDVTNYDPLQDTFVFFCQTHDISLFTKIRVEILLDSEQNYFWKEFVPGTDTGFVLGQNANSTPSCKRGDFQRAGDDTTLGWDAVLGIRVSAEAISDIYFFTSEHRFVGGPRGQLGGFYQYAFQAVNDDGTYQAKSPLSPPSKTVYVENGHINVTPVVQADATEYWIYRRSVIEMVESQLVQSHLDKWYRVGISTGGALEDFVSDTDAIRLNIVANEYLVSVKDVIDSILDMEGLDGGRMFYMTFRDLLLSDVFNPDAIDARFVFRVSGDETEKNLWVRKVTNQTRILATTKDFYEITGTLAQLPDGSIDISIRGIGEAFPPLAANVAAANGGLFYAAKDGWRVTNGSNSQLVSQDLDQLWAGKTVHGIPGIAILPGTSSAYPITLGRDRLYAVAPLLDGTRRLFILNLTTKQWELRYTDPIVLGAAVDGRILTGFGGGSGNALYSLNEGVGVDDVGGFPIFFQTVFDHNQQPRNRKDTFTLKLVMDTGGDPVSVMVAKDGSDTWTTLGTASSDGLSTHYFKLDGVTLGFRYALRIVNSNDALTRFQLTEYTIEYDPRPEQVNLLRIPSTNMGSLARKRVISFAFVVDTLGHNITFTPFVDGSAKATSICTKNGKLTFVHFFLEETIGVDVGGYLEGASANDVFEFYDLNLQETVSEKLPAPARFLIIPADDFGNPNRKRHTSYKFMINTRGHNVRFTPKVDGVTYPAATFNTSEKRTVEYFFDPTVDVTGIDIGGTLESLTTTEFEFYGRIIPQTLEVLPDRLHSLFTPRTNFGSAQKKRIRTVPFVLDCRGTSVSLTPVVDGVQYPSATFTGIGKTTYYYFFETDVFGVDFGGYLANDPNEEPFEFYGYGQMDQVEVLPIPRKFSQFQPMRFDKLGKLFGFRIRGIFTATANVPFTVYNEESPTLPGYGSPLYSDTFPVLANIDTVYEILLPKNVNLTVMRLVIGPLVNEFHQFDVQVKVATSGMESSSRWINIR